MSYDRTPQRLRTAPALPGRLADLLDVDDLVHECGSAGVLTLGDELELDGAIAASAAEVRRRAPVSEIGRDGVPMATRRCGGCGGRVLWDEPCRLCAVRGEARGARRELRAAS